MLKDETVIYPGIDINEFYKSLTRSVIHPPLNELARKFKDNPTETDIFRQICLELRSFNPTNFEEYIWLHKCSCAVFLFKLNLDNKILQTEVLYHAYMLENNDWDISPVHVHLLCKEIYPLLSDNMNLISYSRKICPLSRMGFNVSICLFWALLLRINQHEVKMFRFHKLSTLPIMLPIPRDVIESLPKLHLLLLVISFFQNTIMLKNKLSLDQSSRFKHYFEYKPDDEKSVMKWVKVVSCELSCKYPHMQQHAVELHQIRHLLDNDILHNNPEIVPSAF